MNTEPATADASGQAPAPTAAGNNPAQAAVEPIMQFFAYAHLPNHLQAVSKPFGELAEYVVANLPRNPERSTCLRKLLEGKDAAVRALLHK
jgi:hypothetical protein